VAIGSGLAAQLGFAKETVYGTRVAPSSWYEFNSESLQLERTRLMSRGLRAGRTFQSSSRVSEVTRSAGGSVSLEVTNKDFGRWVDLLHGNAVTPAQVGGTTAYMQTHNLGASDPSKSATIQVGKPGTAGTVHPYEYEGCMVTGYEFSCQTGGFLEASFSIDAEDRTTSQTLGTASYPTSLLTYDFSDVTVATINGVSTLDVFSGFNLSGALSRATDRFRLGSGATKLKPILNDYTAATLTLSGEFKNLTHQALFDAGTIVPVVITFDSGVAAGTGNNYLIRFTCQACQLTGEDPTVGGPDLLDQSLTFNVLDDGTNPPVKIEIQEIATAAL
jgi:hypothetical protein